MLGFASKGGGKDSVFLFEASVEIEYYEATGIRFAKIINKDIKGYKAHGFGGTIEDGSQRSFFPNGLAFYTYGLSLSMLRATQSLWCSSLSKPLKRQRRCAINSLRALADIERYYDQKAFGQSMDWRILKSVEEPLNLGIF